MKKVLLLLFTNLIFSQNIIINGEFSNLGPCQTCPTTAIFPRYYSQQNDRQFTKALGWDHGSVGTPDLKSVHVYTNQPLIPFAMDSQAGIPDSPHCLQNARPCHYFESPSPNAMDIRKNYVQFGVENNNIGTIDGESMYGSLSNNLTPGQQYIFKCSYVTNSDNSLIVQFRNSQNLAQAFYPQVISNIANTNGDWESIIVSINIPLNAPTNLNKIEIGGFNNNPNIGASGFFYMDRIFLEPKWVGVSSISGYTICEEESVELNVESNPNYTYSWTPQNTLSDPNIANPIASPNVTTTYTCEVSYGIQTQTVDVIVVISNGPIINLPSTILMCDSFEELCGPEPIGNDSYLYEWSGPSNTSNQSELLSTNICFTPSQSGSYSLSVTDSYGCTNSHTFSLFDQIPQPDIVIVDCGNINIIGQGFDNPDYTITWYHNGQEVQAGGETLMTSFTDGEITVIISVDGCNSVSDSIEAVCCPDNLELAVNCETGELYVENLPADITIDTVFWNLNNELIPNADDTTLQVTEAGTYSFGIIFTLSNGIECHHFIHYTFSEDDCPSTIFCPDDLELAMNCETGELYVENLPSDITVNTIFWNLNNELIPSATNTTLHVTEAGMYSFGIIFTLSNGVECHHFIHFEYLEGYCCEITGGTVSVDFASEPNTTHILDTPHGPVEFPIFCDSFRISTNNLCENEYYISVIELNPSNWSVVGPNYYEGVHTGNTPSVINLFNSPYNLTLDSNKYYLITFTVNPGGATEHLVFGYDMEEDCNPQPKINITPNPFIDTINIQFEEPQSGRVEVLNMYGRIMKKKEFAENNTVEFNLEDLNPGIYFVKFYIEGEIYTRKIIKN